MQTRITVTVIDDDAIAIGARQFTEQGGLVEALRTALRDDPDLLLLIAPRSSDLYKGIGKVIYASQYAGVPVDSLRIQIEGGEVVSFDELRARHAAG